jgi:hypothetical protein
MNWSSWRRIPWIDTRAKFVAGLEQGGSLLDLGSSDGGTLRHFNELRPDLRLASSDIAAPTSIPIRFPGLMKASTASPACMSSSI